MARLSPPLIVITPVLPPAFDGLGDYCRQLWLNWPKVMANDDQARPDFVFLVSSGSECSRAFWPQVSIKEFQPSAEGLEQALANVISDTVLLQYVGYGYDVNGHPFWLPEALTNWKTACPGRKVLVMFHEAWASGKPWQRVFWQNRAQKRCAAELVKLASVAVTSSEATRRGLTSLGLDKPIQIIPIGASFSVSGAPGKDWRQLLVFGTEYTRLRAIRMHSQLVKSMSRKKLLDRIVLSGRCTCPATDPGAKLISSWKLPLETISCFNFDSDQLPEPVLESGLSLMHTESTCLLKSSCFQLAAKLGQVAITVQELDPGEPVSPGKHYLSYRVQDPDHVTVTLTRLSTLQKISREVSNIGATKLSWPVIARSWADLLKEVQKQGNFI